MTGASPTKSVANAWYAHFNRLTRVGRKVDSRDQNLWVLSVGSVLIVNRLDLGGGLNIDPIKANHVVKNREKGVTYGQQIGPWQEILKHETSEAVGPVVTIRIYE